MSRKQAYDSGTPWLRDRILQPFHENIAKRISQQPICMKQRVDLLVQTLHHNAPEYCDTILQEAGSFYAQSVWNRAPRLIQPYENALSTIDGYIDALGSLWHNDTRAADILTFEKPDAADYVFERLVKINRRHYLYWHQRVVDAIEQQEVEPSHYLFGQLKELHGSPILT